MYMYIHLSPLNGIICSISLRMLSKQPHQKRPDSPKQMCACW